MKRILAISIMVLSFVAVNAQKGTVKTVTVDTLQGNETVNFNIGCFDGEYNVLYVQALCTQLGGTSDGTIVIEQSMDNTSFETLTDLTDVVKGYPNDTLTIVDGAVVMYRIVNPLGCYRLKGAGTASDTTLITPKYRLK